MRLNDIFFNMSKLFLFFALFFCYSFSYAETDSSLSEVSNPILVQQISENSAENSLEDPLENSSEEVLIKENFSNQEESSVLNVRGGLYVGGDVFFGNIAFITPISLEFQIPIGKKNEELKWLMLVGGGSVFPTDDVETAGSYLSIDTGLRYKFQPLTVSLTVGGIIYPFSKLEERDIYLVPPVVERIKWALSVGRKISNTHIALTLGSFAVIYAPFFGLSVSVPLHL